MGSARVSPLPEIFLLASLQEIFPPSLKGRVVSPLSPIPQYLAAKLPVELHDLTRNRGPEG
jgi:hypothetical protein